MGIGTIKEFSPQRKRRAQKEKNGVSLGVDGGGLDYDSGSTYTNFQGPGTASNNYNLDNPTVNCWSSASDVTQLWDVTDK